MIPAYAKTEKYVDGTWTVIDYPTLKKDDIFRMYVGDKVSTDDKGNSVFKATRDAYSPNGFNYTVDCEPYTIPAAKG